VNIEAPRCYAQYARGERADFFIASRAGLDALAKAGKVTPGQSVILGGSLITVAVPAGHPKPDISTTG
jgi:molybdate transport system substrate-binding protein